MANPCIRGPKGAVWQDRSGILALVFQRDVNDLVLSGEEILRDYTTPDEIVTGRVLIKKFNLDVLVAVFGESP